MPDKLHVIYVPGLGDRKVGNQRKAVNSWRLWGVKPELFQMNWGDKEPWEPKFQRLLGRIDELTKVGNSVGLVGVSAGASAVINAYAARKDHLVGVVSICGKINRPEHIAQHYARNNPALITSAHDCEQALKTLSAAERKRIQSRFALYDAIVPRADSYVKGAYNRRVPSIGHIATIGSQIVFGAPIFLHFLKRQLRPNQL